MRFFTELCRRLRWLTMQSRFSSELQDEMQFHIESRADELRQSGVPAKNAFRQAQHEFGSQMKVVEETSETWQIRWLEEIFSNWRYSARTLLRTPAFTCTAVLSLALGIGANTAMFTAADALLFRPLPVTDPASLVTFSVTNNEGHAKNYLPLAFAPVLQASGAFTDVVGSVSDGLSFSVGSRAERIMGEVVTANFFSSLGIMPVLGQAFSPDVKAGRWAPEAVLSYSFWKARFGGDPRVIGRIVRLNTYPFAVVGVSPPSFLDVHQGQDPELRIPVLPFGQQIPQIGLLGADQEFFLIGRLAPGMNRSQAQSVADSQFKQFVRASTELRIRQTGYRSLHLLSGERGGAELAEDYKTPILVLCLLVAVAFLITCANVASMFLARGSARGREFAVRSSLGASRGRLIRQMLSESLLLSLSGGLIGVIITSWASQLLLHFLPQGHLRLVLDLRPDAHSFALILLLCILAALLFGLPAALQTTRGNLNTMTKRDSAGSFGSANALRETLVGFQVAFSLALLVVAGLFVRTVFNLHPKTEYAQAEKVLVFTMKPQQEIYSSDRIRSITGEVARRVSAIPGIHAVGLAENGPFASRTESDILSVPGRPSIDVDSDAVTPGLLQAIGLPILSGRDFTPGDKPGSPNVVILSQGLARNLFPNEDAIGRTVARPSARSTVENPVKTIPSFRVVGIVPDTHYYDARRLTPMAFFAYQKDAPYMPTLHVRVASGDAASFVTPIRRAFEAVDTGFPVFNIRTLADRMEDVLARERMIADLSSAFGVLALLLTAIGLYGVLAYSVTRRTREIGLRIALGSHPFAVMWLIVREALTVVGTGGACGLLISMGAGRLLANRLYGVAPVDPMTLLGATAAMIFIAALATSIPALRASRIDPITALRFE